VNVISHRTRVAPSDRAYQRGIIGNRQKSVNSLTFPVVNNYTAKSLYQYSAINNPQSSVINPSYDLDGTATTTYKYDARNSIADYERGTGVSPVLTLKKTRLWGTDLSGTPQGAGGVAGLLSESHISNPQSPIYYPLYDGNGNISEYLTATGTTAAHFEYDPFGNTVVNTDTANLFTYRFSTKPRDQETGLYYYGFRYYDPTTGRWPSRDSIGEKGGVNLYGSADNDVINKVDYLGKVVIADDVIVGGYLVTAAVAAYLATPAGRQLVRDLGHAAAALAAASIVAANEAADAAADAARCASLLARCIASCTKSCLETGEYSGDKFFKCKADCMRGSGCYGN
jgi:RHS repeat-associated protein